MENAGVFGVDRDYAFSNEELNVLEKLGVKGIGFYLGGPYYTRNGWSTDDVKRTLDAGFGLMPYYVGQNYVPKAALPKMNANQATADAHDALEKMTALFGSLSLSDPIDLDVEQSSWNYDSEQTTEYTVAFIESVRLNHCTSVVYSGLDLISRLVEIEHDPECVHLANWVSKGIDTRLSLANMPGMPESIFINHQRNWQYAGNVLLPGLSGKVDLDLFDETRLIHQDKPAVVLSQNAETGTSDVPKENQSLKSQLRAMVAQFDQLIESMPE